MKLAILACLLAVVAARPQDAVANRVRDREAQILTFKNENKEDGSNENSYTADNGISHDETIELKEVQATDEDGNIVTRVVPFYTGVFSFPLDDGTFVKRRYFTDDTGLHIEADDLPQAPVDPQAPVL
ncbi:cuticle protein AM/CP1114-like [Pollicipes pollicipes]|uniref:cuticle protein AM/CP1114-like n=1 Tax=Pollicipes pollicipes TaxID=41117 RepID=UPI001884F5DF|nr:cuticle protein AM/CP1114-like [Pollicipes pollicipes]